MNKKDVLSILESIISDSFFKDYVIRKSDNSIICKTEYGYKKVWFWYYNSYDLKRDSLALEIRPNYEIRFNVLHKWFEKYSKRTLKDQREDSSIGLVGSMIGKTDDFYFLENRKDFHKDLRTLHDEVVENARYIFSKFATIEGYYDYCINDAICGKRELPNGGFEWVPEYLIATKIVAPSNYEKVKKLILNRVEWMMGRQNPNIELYYNDLPTILEDLENTDFTSGKWGILPPLTKLD